ncbi:MAG: polyphosphate polymerase domain-containing protein [Clostridiaceae bacterium]|nr:polyphosphate polymerase domain-containing protein [Clostridiaceae bacterium]
MTPMRFRHEYKHMISPLEAVSLRQRLSIVMSRDNHAAADGTYQVRSLYFDNYKDQVLQEKLDGVSCREKFRLRVYGTDFNAIKLEKKSKIHGLCCKESAWITASECDRLLLGDVLWMADHPDQVIRDLYVKTKNQLLRPKTLVEYTREAFIFPAGNVRVTLDSHIRTGLSSVDLLKPDLPTFAANLDGQQVLEVKYDAYLPDLIADLVQVENRQATALSKYAVCRIHG